MATIAENITIIKNSIDRMKEALNLPSNTPLENLTLAVEDGGGSSGGGSTVYNVSSIAERDELTGVKDGDVCIIVETTTKPVTDINGIQTLYFPDEIPYTEDMVSATIRMPLADGSDILTCYCNPSTSTDMRFGFYLGSWKPVVMAYACTDGATFKKMEGFTNVSEYTLPASLTTAGSNIATYPWLYDKMFQPATVAEEVYIYTEGAWVALGGGGNTDTSGVYKVATLEERDALSAKEGDVCLVHTIAEFNYDGTQTSNILVLPETITVETPITASASTSLLYGSSSIQRLLFQLSATYFRIRDYYDMTYLAQYTSTDGKTYTKTAGEEQLVFTQDLQPQTTFNTTLTPFVFMKGVQFPGIFSYKEGAWDYLDIAADTPDCSDIWSGKKVYTNYGNLKGTLGDANGKTFNRSLTFLNATTKFRDISYMFYKLNKLTTTEINNYITNRVDVENLENMAYAFYNSSTPASITSLNLSNFNTSNVIDMDRAFNGLSEVASFDMSGFDFQKAKSLSGLVANCSNLTTLKLPTTTQNCVAEDISSILALTRLSSVDLSNFKFPNVKNLYYAFGQMNYCTSIKLPDFTGAKPTNMNYFMGVNKASSVTNLETIDYSDVEDFGTAFSNVNLTTVNLRTDCTTPKLKNASSMFNNAKYLKSINLPNLILSNEADKGCLRNFSYGCFAATTIDLRSLNNPGVANLDLYGFLPNSSAITSEGTPVLSHLDIRSFDFTLGNITSNKSVLFNNLKADCLIIVKDDVNRNWILNNCRSDLTNIKTAAEYGE